MIKRGKSSGLVIAEKCKNILASNWQGILNTVKVDSEDSKEDIYTSRVKFFVKKGRPYIWVPENDLHNVNTVIDERGSFGVSSPLPGPLASILKSIKKLPDRVALVGDAVLLEDEKAKFATKSLRETLLAEQRAVEESSHSVSGILNSSRLGSTSRSAGLRELLEGDAQYNVYKFIVRSCMYIDIDKKAHEVSLEDLEKSKTDCLGKSYLSSQSRLLSLILFIPAPFLAFLDNLQSGISLTRLRSLARFSTSLIDGINQSEARRKALILFCITFLNENAKDAFVLSVDRKGIDVLGKVLGSMGEDGSREYRWKDLRISFKDAVSDVEAFCRLLLEMEEEALKKISSITGL